ncbi:MAG: class I tRNA ligase family protein, partial [Coriobacteriales bacterium]|nr:class I tRNA ligase family protein [Coriobacteriales bacterium]
MKYPQASFPKRAVITAGMPYGNKGLHFGHIGGVYVPADCFARFMRDRIGADNVIFVTGTDCYGSPIIEGYRKLCEAGEFNGNLYDYVEKNHKAQSQTLKNFEIAFDVFEGSGIGQCGVVHKKVSDYFFEQLYKNGWLERRSTPQFYDEQANTLLNGRQVLGKCPVSGCKSEKAYADECDLGHQFMPESLIDPVSTLTGTKPVMKNVENWYFKLHKFKDLIAKHADFLESCGARPITTKAIREFLRSPLIFIKCEFEDEYRVVATKLPNHVFEAAEEGKQSFSLIFDDFDSRDVAMKVLAEHG